MGKLDGKKIAVLVANEGIEQVELTEPRRAEQAARFEREGAPSGERSSA